MARLFRWTGWVVVFAAIFYFSYLNLITYHYLVPAGGDALNHVDLVERIMAGNHRLIFTSYSLWHLLVIATVKLTHWRPITAMARLAPALIGLGALSLFSFNRRFFGWTAGLTTAIIFGFMTLQPLQTLRDGGFPNFLAATTVLPLTLTVVIQIFETGGWVKRLLWSGAGLAMIGLLMLAHNITAIYGLLIICLFLVWELLRAIERRPVGKLLVLIIIPLAYLGLVELIHLFLTQTSLGSGRDIAQMFVKTDNSFPFIHLTGNLATPDALIDITAYPAYIGLAPVYLGSLGILTALGVLLANVTSAQKRAAAVLLFWVTIVAVASQQVGLGFPVRLTRDLAVPLVLLAGLFIGSVVSYISQRRLPKLLAVIVIGLSLGFGLPDAQQRWAMATSPDPLVYHTAADQRMADWIDGNLPVGARVGVFSGDIYLPEFVSHQEVRINLPEEMRLHLTNPANILTVYPDAQYLYIQYRPDRPESWDNIRTIMIGYDKSPYVQLVHKETDQQAEVYLYRVVPLSAVKSTARRSR